MKKGPKILSLDVSKLEDEFDRPDLVSMVGSGWVIGGTLSVHDESKAEGHRDRLLFFMVPPVEEDESTIAFVKPKLKAQTIFLIVSVVSALVAIASALFAGGVL